MAGATLGTRPHSETTAHGTDETCACNMYMHMHMHMLQLVVVHDVVHVSTCVKGSLEGRERESPRESSPGLESQPSIAALHVDALHHPALMPCQSRAALCEPPGSRAFASVRPWWSTQIHSLPPACDQGGCCETQLRTARATAVLCSSSHLEFSSLSDGLQRR